jgi:hypothetical protein
MPKIQACATVGIESTAPIAIVTRRRVLFAFPAWVELVVPSNFTAGIIASVLAARLSLPSVCISWIGVQFRGILFFLTVRAPG